VGAVVDHDELGVRQGPSYRGEAMAHARS
jgi:hypothetical protein